MTTATNPYPDVPLPAGDDCGIYGDYPPSKSIELVQSQYRAPVSPQFKAHFYGYSTNRQD